jgi:serine/threonine protein kinase
MDGSCADENLAVSYVRGELAPGEGERIETHAESCSDCRRFLSELARLIPASSKQPSAPSASEPPAAAYPLLLRGANVGRYVVLDRAGAGGMGVVYAAFDPELDRKVALKLLRTAGADSTRLRLLREAQVLARLSHPNVVAVHDLGAWEGQVFVAMEFIDGWTISTWKRDRHPGHDDVLKVLIAAGRGLAAAHHAGIVHRDFKPDNLLVGKNGRICVTDFGLARERSDEDPVANGYLGQGKPRQALEEYERALRLAEKLKSSEAELADPRLGIARALGDLHRDLPRAHTLAQLAQKAYLAGDSESERYSATLAADFLAKH